MKYTIEEVEHHLEKQLSTPVKNFLEELKFTAPNNQRLRVSLLDSNRRKKRSSASAENWSPESGRLEIWFETGKPKPDQDDISAIAGKPISVTAEIGASPSADAGMKSEPMHELIRALDRAAARPGWDFVALKKFRDETLAAEDFSWTTSDAMRQAVLHDAINRRLVLVSKVPNPKSPQFPVTAIRLNRLMPEVQQILARQTGSSLDFEPIAIRGEGLSTTILRERR
jgi:hypothetical protein